MHYINYKTFLIQRRGRIRQPAQGADGGDGQQEGAAGGGAPQPQGDARQPQGDAPQPEEDAPQPEGDAPQQRPIASLRVSISILNSYIQTCSQLFSMSRFLFSSCMSL